ncbi:S9 family peptidase [candidate division KSB1 bacterium]|nr:S9 family peptidase [candidate division KSB1 bacterium]
MESRINKSLRVKKAHLLLTSLKRGFFTPFLLSIILAGCFRLAQVQKFTYPVARTDDVIEDYHGTRVADPYRWLEDPDAPEMQAWVEAQNRLTFAYLEAIPAREKIKGRLTELWNYPKYSVPRKEGNRYFFSKNDGLQNQSVLYMQKSLDAKPVMVIDPNKFSEDGTVALTNKAFSRDGTLLAYGLSSSGSDWQEIKIRDVYSVEDYEEVIKWCKFTEIAWKHDNSGFYYNRFPEPGTVPEEDRNNYNRVYWHQLGTPQSEDPLVYERPDAKELGFDPIITEDGKHLLLYVYHGTDPKNRIYYRKVESEGPFVRLLDEADARYDPIDNIGSVFYFHTDLYAPRGRVIAIDIKNPAMEDWREIIPQQDDVISSVTMVNNQFVVAYMHDAHHQLKLYDLDGTFVHRIELPTLGSIADLSGRREDTEMFFAFASFLYPTSIFRYDFIAGQLTQLYGSEINFDPSGYETKQVFYSSKDGTRVPMFITHRKGLTLDGNNPTLLYGYGGFNISITPRFSTPCLIWLENGGVYAVANLRGGDEYGEAWHQSGMLDKKQNVFDDFIAAAEWLIENEYTNPSKLAINGGSNGGLLVAACMLQRPELFGAVICRVPVTDMLRYHKFTVGRYWVPEYGNAETNPDHFKFLYAYSPLHNVKKGVVYPPILVTTADTDDRVAPLHAKKFTATLQAAATGENPILLRVETKAGHGRGKPTSKVIDEQSDIYAFLFKIFGMGSIDTE